ncbi:MAG: maf protein [Thermoleophilia bacterium]|jgi:septum formation protein|nr:maf protein [Thermoleophilia bacterium]
MGILLASKSPQRHAILTQLELPFRVVVPDVEELEMGSPDEVAIHNARLKAAAVADQARPGELVLACDTVVDVDGIPFGKPQNAEEAFTMLALLRGRVHNVVGGVVVIDPATETAQERTVRTMVRFRDFSDELLQRYLDGGEWAERAGGYAIQGTGAAMVAGIGGDYQNVVGLPVAALLGMLEETADWNDRARSALASA